MFRNTESMILHARTTADISQYQYLYSGLEFAVLTLDALIWAVLSG